MAAVDISSQYKRIVQLFWDPEPVNDNSMEAIWCLGEKYESVEKETYGSGHAGHTQAALTGSSGQVPLNLSKGLLPGAAPSDNVPPGPHSIHAAASEENGWPKGFLDDFESRFWFTYRSHFPPIERSQDPDSAKSLTIAVRLRNQLVDQGGFTSDTGFGCMIRSGQCLLANAMAVLRLGRGWRRGAKQDEERQLLSLFADDPKAPFSVHRFVAHGASECGKHPGEWFGPSATARCIKALSQQHNSSGLNVYVNGDGADVYQDQVLGLARAGGQSFTPVLILLGIRLGIERVTPVYWEALAQALQLRQSIGIAGGRPSASHYFVGVQGTQFFYLDPHRTRPMLPFHPDAGSLSDDDIASCHTRRLRCLPVEQMDPSMLIAFLIQNEEDWEDWKAAINATGGKSLLRIADSEPATYGGSGQSSVDDVETFDDESQEQDGELIDPPMA